MHNAGTGVTVSANHVIKGPLGLVIGPNGDILSGSPKGAGTLFGLAVKPAGTGVYFVDDAMNTLELLR